LRSPIVLVLGEKGRDPPLLVVGTRSRAIRGGRRKGRWSAVIGGRDALPRDPGWQAKREVIRHYWW